MIINNTIHKKTAMMKKSKLYEHFRELVAGENQCDSIVEWASELPIQTNVF